jgi:cell division septation protein DedD
VAVGTKRGGKDVVLGGRHLVGFFFLLVVVLGVVFTLGYLLGRSQYDTQLRAASGNSAAPPTLTRIKNTADKSSDADKPDISPSADNNGGNGSVGKSDKSASASANAKSTDAPAPPAPTADWDFYHSAEPAKPAEKLSPPPPPSKKPLVLSASNHTAANGGASGASRGNGRSLNSPLIPRGATVLQVAALARQADALSLAQALQQKKFPAFVLPPDADHFYRVQVGPYTDAKAANAARQRLDKQGFKYIIKR